MNEICFNVCEKWMEKYFHYREDLHENNVKTYEDLQ